MSTTAAGRLAGRAGSGRHAEELAALHLEAQGFRIVARNWRRPEGEIDIVADHEGVCVFVEVRSRGRTDRGHPLETITAGKRARVIRSARMFMHEELPRLPPGDAPTGFRFDVIGVSFDANGDVSELVHVADAFQVQ